MATQKSAAEAAAWRDKLAADSKRAASGRELPQMDLVGLRALMAKQTLLPVSYKKKDILIYAVGIGCDEERFVYELNPGFEMFPTFPASLFRKGDSDDVHFQKYQPVVRAAGLPYRSLGCPPPRMVFDAERYVECVRPMPLSGEFRFRFQTTAVMWKKKGKSIINEYTATLEDASGEVYYRCWCSAYAVMGARVAQFADVGRSASERVEVPAASPDAVGRVHLDRRQTLMYRLTGDFGPGDASLGDPAGFFGLGSLALVSRSVLKAFGNNEARAFHAVRVRFVKPVFSGQTLETRMWVGAGGPPGTRRVLFRTTCVQTGGTVIENAYMDLKEGFFRAAGARL